MSTVATSLNALNPNVAEVFQPYSHRITAPVNIIVLCYHPGGYIFDHTWAEMIKKSGKPSVILNFEEFGWNRSWNHKCAIGIHHEHFLMYGERKEREKLHEFLGDLNIAAYFLREFSNLFQWTVTGYPILPIELLSPNLPPPPTPNKDEYMSRSGAFHWYGISHPDRMELHSALNASGLPVNALEIHHTERKPLMDVMSAQSRHMASVCLSGAGHKVFRLTESSWNSVPIIDDVGMEYRVQPNDSNAIMLETENGRVKIPEAIHKIQTCLDDKEGMWERMKLAHENAKRLQIDNYMSEINKEIESYL
jgi:hypothetical protein